MPIATPRPEPLLLPSSEPPQAASDRLFFALLPDAATAALLVQRGAELAARYRLSGRLLESSRLHVTLHHVGDFAGLPADVVARACAGASAVHGPLLEVELDRFMSFARRARHRPFVLLVKSPHARLTCLVEGLRAALQQQGFPLRSDAFTPHLTLCHDKLLIPCTPMAPVSWTAREFALIHSLLGRTRHIPLARWPLSSS